MHQSSTLSQFNALSNPDKYATLEDQGTYLDVYTMQGDYKIALFDLQGFYVEVWLNRVTDKLWKAVAFDEYEKLDPFLNAIDLRGVYCML